MKETLETINQMLADGVIIKYAIGGAVGATLYLEPVATLDVDVFVELPGLSERTLVSLSPIYQYLGERGWKPQGEHIVIGQWPVRLLTPSNSLEQEALLTAIQTDAGGIPTWLMTAEHLIAIALQTDRAKEHATILQFLDLEAVNHAALDHVLMRHGLFEKWEKFQSRYFFDTAISTIDERRRSLAALNFGEKLELLEKLRERSLFLAAAREQLARQKRQTTIDWSECDLVEADRARCGGRPVLKGTRMPVEDVIGNYEHGVSLDEICTQFGLNIDHVKRLLIFAESQHALTRPLS